MKSQKVFFFHVPKCAGTSIWHYIRKIHGRRSVLRLRSKDDVVAFEEAMSLQLRRYSAVGGHHWLSTYRDKLDDLDESFKITALIDRLNSTCNYIITSRRHRLFIEAKNPIFEDFSSKEMANMQTRLLTGSEDLEKAIELLNGWFDDYATTDQGHLLKKKLSEVGNLPLKRERRDNLSKRVITRESIDPALLGRLEDIQQADVRLFEYAENRQTTTVDGD